MSTALRYSSSPAAPMVGKEAPPRVLVVDDNADIHRDFLEILSPKREEPTLRDLERELFGEELGKCPVSFAVDSAFQGDEGLMRVVASLENDSPYSVAFVDVRMPPGWDGLETVEKLWQEDPRLQVVLCTAYSDYSWEQITEKLGQRDKLLILKKPFDYSEVRQMAVALTRKWQLGEQARNAKKELEEQVRVRTKELVDVRDELLASNRRLQEESKRADAANRAKSVFLANMSHEIRTPMNGVVGMINLVLGTELRQQQKEYLELGLLSAKSLLGIINDILDLSKIESGKLEIFNSVFELEPLVRDIMRLLAPQAKEKGVAFKCEFGSTVPRTVLGDKVRIRQIITNILGNALKFTKRGSVILSLDGTLADNGNFDLRMCVADTGVGIPKDKLKTVFGSFSQAHNDVEGGYGGTGLGLAIVKNLVEMMGGTIGVASVEGQGTEFTIELSMPTGGSMLPSREPPMEDCSMNGRILLAEDNLVNQKLAVAILRNSGFTVEVAVDGESAVREWETGKYDLVLMDCQMPKMNGYDATRRIRSLEDGHRTPIIAMTANALLGDREKCIEAGMDDYISKPVDPSILLSTVGALLGKD